MTIRLIEHDLGMVMDISNHVAVLNFGRLVTSGRPEEVRTNPDVVSAYIGAADVVETKVSA